MPYCTTCGSAIDQLPPAIPVAETVPADVRIAEINAEKEIKLAQLAHRSERDWNETRLAETEIEAAASVERAEAEAEVIGDIINAETETAEEPAPAVVTDMPEDEEPDEDLAPPEVDHHDAEPKEKAAWVF